MTGFWGTHSKRAFSKKTASVDFAEARNRMIESQLKTRGIFDKEVLGAFQRLPRELFVSEERAAQSYEDYPLPIGFGQTISQPYIVAYMTEMLEVGKDDKVLEIGTGSGFQTAVLAELANQVYSIEIIKELYFEAVRRLENLSYRNVFLKHGDGGAGWPEHAPYDRIIITAGARRIPPPLEEQLKDNGILIAPVGAGDQELVLERKRRGRFTKKKLIGVRFVPLSERP